MRGSELWLLRGSELWLLRGSEAVVADDKGVTADRCMAAQIQVVESEAATAELVEFFVLHTYNK